MQYRPKIIKGTVKGTGWPIDCPLCGQKCWKMPAADKLKAAQAVTYLCTECAVKAGFLADYPKNRRKPGGNREQRRRAKRNARR